MADLIYIRTFRRLLVLKLNCRVGQSTTWRSKNCRRRSWKFCSNTRRQPETESTKQIFRNYPGVFDKNPMQPNHHHHQSWTIKGDSSGGVDVRFCECGLGVSASQPTNLPRNEWRVFELMAILVDKYFPSVLVVSYHVLVSSAAMIRSDLFA